MQNLTSTVLFTFLLDPRAFPSLLRITEPHAFFGHTSHTPPALALRSQHTSTFLISPTSRPQTENFSTEPSANSSFPSGRSSHSLSVCTFWGPMMMMKTRLSVLESYSVPVVMVMWYGITVTQRGLIIRKPTHTHALGPDSRKPGAHPIRGSSCVCQIGSHPIEFIWRSDNSMLCWARSVLWRLLSHGTPGTEFCKG